MKIRWGFYTMLLPNLYIENELRTIDSYDLEVPDNDLKVCKTKEEKDAVIEFYVKKEFENKVHYWWSIP
jgi:hypothetical protein